MEISLDNTPFSFYQEARTHLHSMTFLDVISGLQSPNNDHRRACETQYASMLTADPNNVAHSLISGISDPATPVNVKQLCLINIKQLVPKYWSLGFPQFVGPPINQELKQQIRLQLLASVSSTDAKVRGAAAYCIVQIAVTDFPDEWPSLLNDLYDKSVNFADEAGVIGSLTVFADLFDDLITEDQFWEGHIGNQISANLGQLLQAPQAQVEAKIAGMKLYKQAILPTLESQEAVSSPDRKQQVLHQISTMLPLFLSLIEGLAADNHHQWQLRELLYIVVCGFIGSFNKRIDPAIKSRAVELAVRDLQVLMPVYQRAIAQSDASNDAVNMMSAIVDTISVGAHSVNIPDPALASIFAGISQGSVLPPSQLEAYEGDFNTYVSDITGLSTESSLRESISMFLADTSSHVAQRMWPMAVERVISTSALELEAALYVLEQLLVNDDAEYDYANQVLEKLMGVFGDNPLVNGSLLLLLPRFFEKFEGQLGTKVAADAIVEMVAASQNSDSEIQKISTLVSLTYYSNFLKLKEQLRGDVGLQVQQGVFHIAASLVEDADDDGLPPLLEAITAASSISPDHAVNVTELLFKIALKDAANVQLTLDAKDALAELLVSTKPEAYMVVASTALPIIVGIVNSTTQEYTPELYLSLELLGVLFGYYHPAAEFPKPVFEQSFPLVYKVVMASVDNQILQSGAEVLNKLIGRTSEYVVAYNSDGRSGLDMILQMSSKLLSPELDDSAAMYTGLVILSLVEKFQSYLSTDYLVQILDATVQRLVIAKHPVTVENLILVFCHLILTAPSDMINFLKSTTVNDKSALATVLPIWFDSYEVTRGYDKISKNSMALGKLYSLDDPEVVALVVNGDIIPYDGDKIVTRSMKAHMPDQYTHISAMLKIIKLLVGELQFQLQQPDADDFLPTGGDDEGEGDGDGWEDMDDIGVPNYEKLKSYVEDDTNDTEAEPSGDGSLLRFLTHFFKECAQKNLANFEQWYPLLKEDEKKSVTEAVVF